MHMLSSLRKSSTQELSCSLFPRAELGTSKLGLTTDICRPKPSVDISSCTSGQILPHKPVGVLISAKMASLDRLWIHKTALSEFSKKDTKWSKTERGKKG